MAEDEKTFLRKIVEGFVRSGIDSAGEVKVVCLPDNKTSFVEKSPVGGNSIMLDEFTVDGKIIWAGYSRETKIVYLSSAPGR